MASFIIDFFRLGLKMLMSETRFSCFTVYHVESCRRVMFRRSGKILSNIMWVENEYDSKTSSSMLKLVLSDVFLLLVSILLYALT